MRRNTFAALRTSVLAFALLLLGACSGVGVDAGGETNGSNGGVAFIILASFLVVGALILWFILGRED